MSATISSAFSLSRSPVGSSAQTIAGSFTSARAIAEPDHLQRRQRLTARLLGGNARDEQRQFDVLHGAENRNQVVELEHEPHPAGAVVGTRLVGHLVKRDALDEDVTRIDRVEPREAVEQGRLAGAARSHDRDHLAAPDGEAHIAQGVDYDLARVVTLVDRPGFDDCLRDLRLDRNCRAGPWPRLGQHGHSDRLLFVVEATIARMRHAAIGVLGEPASEKYGFARPVLETSRAASKSLLLHVPDSSYGDPLVVQELVCYSPAT
jgi:hypothetical protein